MYIQYKICYGCTNHPMFPSKFSQRNAFVPIFFFHDLMHLFSCTDYIDSSFDFPASAMFRQKSDLQCTMKYVYEPSSQKKLNAHYT
uniref:Uncharacterized protein n=1 Tax=Arundo donax TaxID=35708 RepID=A0A0A9HH40_ARUDO